MNIGLSNGVDKSSIKGVVDKGGVSVGNVGGGVGQSIPEICNFSMCQILQLDQWSMTILRVVTFAYICHFFSWKAKDNPRAATGGVDNCCILICIFCICLCSYLYFYMYPGAARAP